jgi:hypothetical protein
MKNQCPNRATGEGKQPEAGLIEVEIQEAMVLERGPDLLQN